MTWNLREAVLPAPHHLRVSLKIVVLHQKIMFRCQIEVGRFLDTLLASLWKVWFCMCRGCFVKTCAGCRATCCCICWVQTTWKGELIRGTWTENVWSTKFLFIWVKGWFSKWPRNVQPRKINAADENPERLFLETSSSTDTVVRMWTGDCEGVLSHLLEHCSRCASGGGLETALQDSVLIDRVFDAEAVETDYHAFKMRQFANLSTKLSVQQWKLSFILPEIDFATAKLRTGGSFGVWRSYCL